jgi:hypothetical protein
MTAALTDRDQPTVDQGTWEAAHVQAQVSIRSDRDPFAGRPIRGFQLRARCDVQRRYLNHENSSGSGSK